MENLIVKEIKFDGKGIVTALIDEKVYVSIKSVCSNLGMNEDVFKNQKKKIQNDELLKLGSILTPLNTEYGIKETMMLELDYLPIWLAKINPSRFSDELKLKLLDYQLRVKDVLADEFLGERKNKNVGKYEPELKEIEDRTNRIKNNRNKIKELLVQIASDYDWISFRADLGYERTKKNYQETKRNHFIIENRNLTTEDIDNLNIGRLKNIEKRLED